MRKNHFLLFLLIMASTVAISQDITEGLPDTIENGRFEMDYGGMHFSGDFADFKRTGNWVTSFPNGQVHIIETFHDGLKQGIYLKINRRGSLIEQSEYINDSLNGKLLRYNPGGKLQLEENYNHGKLDGVRCLL